MNIINEISSKIKYHKNIIFNSEIILGVNQTGMNNIMNHGSSNNNPCPSKIYLNDEEVQRLTDFTRINITKPESIVKLVWDNPLNTNRSLFSECSNIIEIKFLNFDTSSLTEMSFLFEDCHSLILVDLSNLIIKKVNSIKSMFKRCYSLKFVNFFDFYTSNISEMNIMFYDCHSLNSIDLSTFDTSKITDMHQMFYNCINMEYINLLNFTDINNPLTENMFYGIKDNTVICIDKNKAPSIYNLVDNMTCVSISCRPDWQNVQNKLIETGECLIYCNSSNNRYL